MVDGFQLLIGLYISIMTFQYSVLIETVISLYFYLRVNVC